MTTKKAIQMINQYLEEPNSISKDWIEALLICRQVLLDREKSKEEHKDFVKRMGNLHAMEIMVINRTNEIKTEAINDFAEKVKEVTYHYYDSEIDEVKKEMVGDNK